MALTVVAIFALAMTSGVLAQDRGNRLELSDEQRAQIRELVQQERTDARESRQELRGRIADLLTDEQREQILDEAIRVRFEPRARSGRANRGARGTNVQRGQERGASSGIRRDSRGDIRRDGTERGVMARRSARASGPARMLRSLNLTDDQRARVGEILKAERDAVSAWRESNANAERAERASFMEERKNATREAIREILTDEQKARFDEHAARRTERSQGAQGAQGTKGERRSAPRGRR